MQNHPDLWRNKLPRPSSTDHKYDRGYCIVMGGAKLTGAARLTAEVAARVGAGLVTVIAPEGTGVIYRTACAAHIMVEDFTDASAHLADDRRNVAVIGPGLGTRQSDVVGWLTARRDQRLILDADALNVLAQNPEALKYLRAGDVLTPHAGEYQRLCGDETVIEAARRMGCIIVLKGAQTRITDGTQVILNDHSSPYLATAGTGDVLAGMIAGLMAQGMNGIDAACAAVWIHGEAGLQIGPGLVASDLQGLIPGVLERLGCGNPI